MSEDIYSYVKKLEDIILQHVSSLVARDQEEREVIGLAFRRAQARRERSDR